MPKQAGPGSPISNQEWENVSWEYWEHNVGSRAVFLPPSYISLWGRGWVAFLFSAGTPRWVRHRFQSIQMCSVAHKAFSLEVGCENQPHILASMWDFFFLKGKRQQRFSLIGRSTPQGVKRVQTWNILTRELCWLGCEGVNGMYYLQIPDHFLKSTAWEQIEDASKSSAVWEFQVQTGKTDLCCLHVQHLIWTLSLCTIIK